MPSSLREVIECPWCGSREIERVARRADGIPVARCGGCRLVFTGMLPEDLSDFYTPGYFSRDAPAWTPAVGYDNYEHSYFPANFRWFGLFLRAVAPEARDLLDIGCATGTLLVMARALGFQGSGSELEDVAAERARRRGFEVVTGPFDASNWKDTFDVVVAFEVLEHVRDLRTFLEGVQALLDASGVFCFLVPDVEARRIRQYGDRLSDFQRSLEHTYYFDEKFLRRMCGEVFGDGALTVISLSGDQQSQNGAYLLGIVRPQHGAAGAERRLEEGLRGHLDGLTTGELEVVALTAARFARFGLADRALARISSMGAVEDRTLLAQVALHKGHLHEAFRALWREFEEFAERDGFVVALQAEQLVTTWLASHGIGADPGEGFARLDDLIRELRTAIKEGSVRLEALELSLRDAESAARLAQERVLAREAELATIFASRAWSVVKTLRAGKRVASRGRSLSRAAVRRCRSALGSRRTTSGIETLDLSAEVLPALPAPWDYVASVVIPVFNKGVDLSAALESVWGQTLSSVEVVIWDDGSTRPETKRVIEDLERAGHPDVAIFRGPNRGVCVARNAALAASRGYFVCCLDPDDVIAPTYLEKAVALLSADTTTALAYSWVRVTGDRAETWCTQDLDARLILDANHVPTCAVFRREVVRGTGGFRPDMRSGFEDWEHWAHAAKLGFRGRAIREELFHYRYSEDTNVSLDARARARKDEILEGMRRDHSELASGGGNTLPVRRHPVIRSDWWAEQRRKFPAGKGAPVIVAIPWFTLGGADLILAELFHHWRATGRTFVVISTSVLGPGMVNRFQELLDLSPFAYSLPEFLPRDYWLPFVTGIGRSLDSPTLLIQGSTWAYECLGALRERVPKLRVIDKHFNGVGHFESSLRQRDHIDLTVVCNAALRDTFLAAGWEDRKTVTIYDSVMFPARRLAAVERQTVRDSVGIPRDARIILFVGRLSAEKRPEWALDLAEALVEEGVWLLIVGDGPLRRDVERRLRRAENVAWLREVRREDMADIYSASDVLIVSSVTEGVPLTVLEAASVGVPIVATRVGGLVEWENRRGIHLVSPQSFRDFVAGVRRVLADPVPPAAPTSPYDVGSMIAAWDDVLEYGHKATEPACPCRP